MQRDINYNLELYHEGIKGQKWGVKNGPPYPLSKEEHDLVVRKRDYAKAKKEEKVENLKNFGKSTAITIGANAALYAMGAIAPLLIASTTVAALATAGSAAAAAYWEINENTQNKKLKKDELSKLK